MTMKMEMTELGPMKRALKIEVSAEEVAQRFLHAYSELNRQVRIPGFRPGKAPKAITWPSPELPAGPLTFDSAIERGLKLTITKGLVQPWSMAFLPDGRILVTEIAGRLRVVKDGEPLMRNVTIDNLRVRVLTWPIIVTTDQGNQRVGYLQIAISLGGAERSLPA